MSAKRHASTTGPVGKRRLHPIILVRMRVSLNLLALLQEGDGPSEPSACEDSSGEEPDTDRAMIPLDEQTTDAGAVPTAGILTGDDHV